MAKALQKKTYWSEYLPALKNKAVNEALASVFFKNKPLNRWLRKALATDGSNALMADPVFEALFPWQAGKRTVKQMEEKGLFSRQTLDALENAPICPCPRTRKPYAHQQEAYRYLLDKSKANSVIVSSGTGSGKTECFMIPLLEDLVRERIIEKNYSKGIRALFLYPLNALIDSQRDRLRSWSSHFRGDITYCLYNGETPEIYDQTDPEVVAQPERLFDRESIRQRVPDMLLTNPSMLERILLNRKDESLIQTTRDAQTFRWVIIDEAHTYIGSRAAELALLIRRVLNAFGTDPKNVHFVATSATVDASDKAACNRLRKFLQELSGTDDDRVHLVLGHRNLPQAVPTKHLKDRRDCSALEALADPARPADLIPYLKESRTAMTIRNHFIEKGYARLSTLKKLTGIEDSVTLMRWLDLLSFPLPEKAGQCAFLPLRLHQLFNTTGTISACVNPNCSKKDPELQDDEWHFGQVWLDDRDTCECGAMVLPLAACSHCNNVALKAKINLNTQEIGYPDSKADDEYIWNCFASSDKEDIGDEDSLRIDGDTAENEVAPDGKSAAETDNPLSVVPSSSSVYEPILIVNDPEVTDAQTGNCGHHEVSYIEPDLDTEKFTCPSCHDKLLPNRFYLRRISNRYVSALMPFMLDHAEAGKRDVQKPQYGHRLIAFTDARQGTAKNGALLEREGERSFIATTVYEMILEHIKSLAEKPALDPASVENMRKTLPADQFALIMSSFESKQDRRLPWSKVVECIAKQLPTSTLTANKLKFVLRTYYNGNISEDEPERLAEYLLFREFRSRPVNGPSLESTGLISIDYPKLDGVTSPFASQHVRQGAEWLKDNKEWRKYLKIILDFFVRSNLCLTFPQKWKLFKDNLYAFEKAVLSPDSKEEPSKQQTRWPSIRPNDTCIRNKLLHYTAEVCRVAVPYENNGEADRKPISSADRDFINDILAKAFKSLKDAKLLEKNVEGVPGYVLKPANSIAFRLNDKAYWFSDTNKLFDTIIGAPEDAVCPQNPLWHGALELQLPKLNDLGDLWDDDIRSARAITRNALQESDEFHELLDQGLWNRFALYALEHTNYFSATEHSAQIDKQKRRDVTEDFKKGFVNILSCSTTMEMGVDLDDINTVVMNNVPPQPANYMQRSGRAGRRGETRANTMTLCANTPRENQIFREPDWALREKQPSLSVSLDSPTIIQRHINAQLLSEFFGRVVNRSSDKELTVEEWLDQYADSYIEWLDNLNPEGELETELNRITRYSALSIKSAHDIVTISAHEAVNLKNDWKRQVLLFNNRINRSKSEREKKAMTIGLTRLLKNRLYDALTADLYLPSSIRILNVTPFNYMSASDEKDEHDKAMKAWKNKKTPNFSSLPSRPARQGIFEYAPGASVVKDNKVYVGGGFTLNWQAPASSANLSEIQQLKRFVHCPHCNHNFISEIFDTDIHCPSCYKPIELKDIRQAFFPAGFAVEGSFKPHMDFSSIRTYRRNDDIVTIRKPWHSLGQAGLAFARSSDVGTVLSYNAGEDGQGFAVCLDCGWSKPMSEIQDTPEAYRHFPLRRYSDGACVGGTGENNFKMQKNVILVAEEKTDCLDVAFSLKSFSAADQKNRTDSLKSAGIGIGVALRRAVAEHFGIDEDEIGYTSRPQNVDGKSMLIVSLYDRNCSGYCSKVENELPALLRKARGYLDCPRDCSCACSACILTFDNRHTASILNRKDAMSVLTTELLRSLEVPAEWAEFAGDNTQYLNQDLDNFLVENAQIGTINDLKLFFAPIDEDLRPIGSPMYSMLSTLTALPGFNVSLVAEAFDWNKLTAEQQSHLSMLSDVKYLACKRSPEPKKVLLASFYDVTAEKRKAIYAAAETFDYWEWSGNATLFVGTCANEPETVPADAPQWLQTQTIVQNIVTSDSVVLTRFDFNQTNTLNLGEKLLMSFARKQKKHSIEDLLGSEPIESIVYTDRYMLRPIHFTLILSTIKAILNHAKRPQQVPVRILTIQDIETNPYNSASVCSLGHSWPNQDFRDDTLMEVESIVNVANSSLHLECNYPSGKLDHFRRLSIRFGNRKTLHIGFDQGQDFAMLLAPSDPTLRRYGVDPKIVATQILAYLRPASAVNLGQLKPSAQSIQIVLWWE